MTHDLTTDQGAMGDINREDLRNLAEDVKEHARSGFEQINARLDRLNHKTEKHGEELARHGVRLTNVEKEIFPRPLRRESDQRGEVSDLKRLLAGIGVIALAAWGLIEGVFMIGDVLHRMGLR